MNIIFMIESGKGLVLVKEYLAERKRVSMDNDTLVKELGVKQYSVSRMNGRLLGVHFEGALHPDFKKPVNGISSPKKGTEWYKRFAAQRGYESASVIIAREFNIPLSISYEGKDCKGGRCIGEPLAECGFLYLGYSGPYAMWIPDVEAEVKAERDRGCTVDEEAASFKPEFDGCRRIEVEEWNLLVAQYKFDQKTRQQAEQAAG